MSAPSRTHVVKSGESLSRIAAENGFGDIHTILDHPNNASLKDSRPNPDVLFPGDEVFLPEREDKIEKADTGKLHLFSLSLPLVFLRLRPKDLDGKLLKKEAECLLSTGDPEDPVPLNPDGDGIIEREISATLPEAELRVIAKNMKMDLLIGELDPVVTLSGQRARLNNLGYFAGFTRTDRKLFRWAAEEFKKDKAVSPLAVKEEDIDEVEGIKQKAFRDKLEKEHGS